MFPSFHLPCQKDVHPGGNGGALQLPTNRGQASGRGPRFLGLSDPERPRGSFGAKKVLDEKKPAPGFEFTSSPTSQDIKSNGVF